MADETKFTQADIDKAIKDAVEEATKGLKQNLSDALDEAKEAKRKLRAASEIKPEDLTAAEERADRAEAALKDALKQAKDATTAKEKAEKALGDEQGVTRKLIAENGLREQLAANGVTNAVHQKAAMALLSPQVQVVAEGDTRVAKAGDKSLTDFVKAWAGGEEGKHFVSAPVNSGGGAGGGGGKQPASTMTREAYNALDQLGRAEAGMKAAKGELKIVDNAA
jgi:hypothetical protein